MSDAVIENYRKAVKELATLVGALAATSPHLSVDPIRRVELWQAYAAVDNAVTRYFDARQAVEATGLQFPPVEFQRANDALLEFATFRLALAAIQAETGMGGV